MQLNIEYVIGACNRGDGHHDDDDFDGCDDGDDGDDDDKNEDNDDDDSPFANSTYFIMVPIFLEYEHKQTKLV